MAPTPDAVAGDATQGLTNLTPLKAKRARGSSTYGMKRLNLVDQLVLGGLLALTGLCASAATPERGEAVVRRHCAGCHAVGLVGDSPEPAAPRFRELYQRYQPEALGEALAGGILTGHPLMPAFRFEPEDVQSIILYLKSLQVKQGG